MLSIKKVELVSIGNELFKRIEGECLTTDVKPTDVANGSQLLVINTETHSTKLLHYCKESETWLEIE